MFFHNFKYSLLLLLKNKSLVFWTLAFPIIMAMLFNMAFSDLESEDKFDVIDIAVVNSTDFDNNTIFKKSLESLSEGDDKLFNISYVGADRARTMLEDREITAYLVFHSDDVKVTVNSNGIEESIVCYVVEEIKSDCAVIMDVGTQYITSEIAKGNYDIDYEQYFTNTANDLLNHSVNIKDDSSSNLSYSMIEYYSLIAMTCLYSGLLSMTLINYRLANISSVGKRSTISPVRKGGMILGSLAASFVVQLFGLLILYLFMLFFIKVDFGTNLPFIIALSVMGVLAGLTFGVACAVLLKLNENAKLTALIAATMVGSFLSGMMGITMKNIVDKNVPVLNWINPVAMITDGLYSLYYYETPDRFYFDVISLAIFSAVMILISIRGLRRQKYDSI